MAIQSSPCRLVCDPYNQNEDEEFPFLELLKLYVFAWRFDIPQFHDDVSKAFFANTNQRPTIIPRAELEKAYSCLHDKSPMQPFIEDRYTLEWASGPVEPSTDPNLPPRSINMVVKLRPQRLSVMLPSVGEIYPPAPPIIQSSDDGTYTGTSILAPWTQRPSVTL